MLALVFDNVLQALRSSRLGRLGHGHVDQDREASSLFAGDFVGTTTIEAEFSRSILGLGVMDNLGGEVISLSGETWFVPQDGTPRVAAPEDTLAFGIAGLPHAESSVFNLETTELLLGSTPPGDRHV